MSEGALDRRAGGWLEEEYMNVDVDMDVEHISGIRRGGVGDGVKCEEQE